MARQRIRVEGRDAYLVGAVSVVAGILASLGGPSPTGSTFVDIVLVVVFGGGAVWAAASAPWWAGVAAAGIGAAFAPHAWLLAVAAAAGLGGLWIGLQRRSLPWSRALVAAVALEVLCRLGSIERFGLTSLIGIGTMGVLAVLGVRRRPRRERRVLWWAAGATLGVAGVAAFGFGVAALQARSSLTEGNREARNAIDQLGAGNFAEAQAGFARAASLFASADTTLSRPWAMPAGLVPVLAQHRRSAVDLSAGAADVSESIARTLSVVDYDSLRMVDGRIDLDSIVVLEQPLTELTGALGRLRDTVEDVRSPWLVPAFDRRLADLLVDVDEQGEKADNALVAVQQAPAMLGADGPRVYFLAFTTPSEARGLGGYMGNWAEVTITDGELEVSDFGRTIDLFGGAEAKTFTSMTDEYAERYGDFLLNDVDNRLAGIEAWSNITVSPDFPSVASTIADLYPQSGGKQLDGVFVLDIFAIAKLMEITGPIDLPEVALTLEPANAVQFLLEDQYSLEERADRVDLLETVALTTVQRLLSSTLPAPPELGRMFGQLGREGRLAGWATRPQEQEVYDRVNMAGRLPARDGGDGLAVSFINAAGNKIDYFLTGDVAYDVEVDRSTDTVRGTVTVTLTNSAPSSGLPAYVIDTNESVGLPPGTNLLYVSVYTGLPVTGYALDGDPAGVEVATEGEYFTSSALLDLRSGETHTVTVFVEGSIADDVPYSVTLFGPRAVTPLPMSVTVNDTPLSEQPWDEPGTTRLP